MFCKYCGKEINDNAVICVYCGCETENNKSSGCSWFVTLLLCFFLGMFGMHRFYTGHTKSGGLQIFLTIIGALTLVGLLIPIIWVFFDFCDILTGKFKTADGKLLKK